MPDASSDTVRFGFSATLRVMCAADRHGEIESATGLTPTHRHEEGELGFMNRPWPRDLWILESPHPRGADLNTHL